MGVQGPCQPLGPPLYLTWSSWTSAGMIWKVVCLQVISFDPALLDAEHLWRHIALQGSTVLQSKRRCPQSAAGHLHNDQLIIVERRSTLINFLALEFHTAHLEMGALCL